MGYRFLAIVLAVLAAPAWAQVGGAAQHSCEVDANPIVFGNYDPTSSAPNDASSEIVLRCTCTGNGCGALHYRLELAGERGMTGGTDGTTGRLGYEIYSDPSRTQRVGQAGEAYSGIYQPPNNGDRVLLPLYGRMAPLQPATPGSYAGQELVILIY
jgi:spore coat protein U-like protein